MVVALISLNNLKRKARSGNPPNTLVDARAPVAGDVMRRYLGNYFIGVQIYKRTIIALIPLAFIASCGTTALSRNENTEVNSGKKALLRTYNQPILSGIIFGDQPVATILSAEGMNKGDMELLKLDKAIAVDVGLNKVIVGCTNRAKDDERNFTDIIQIEFKPYHEYSVSCSFDSVYGSGGSYVARFSVEENRLK